MTCSSLIDLFIDLFFIKIIVLNASVNDVNPELKIRSILLNDSFFNKFVQPKKVVSL